jgi:ParB family chromosome partitioning protein
VAEKLAAQQLVRLGKPSSKRTSSDEPTLSPAIQTLQNLLTRRLATRVVIHHAEKRGSISIEYYGNDDLHRIMSELGIDPEQP